MDNNPNAVVPVSFLEAQEARHAHGMAVMAIGWVVSVIVLSLALLLSFSTVTTVEDEPSTTTVDQTADNSGSNTFSSGDITEYGGETESNDNQE